MATIKLNCEQEELGQLLSGLFDIGSEQGANWYFGELGIKMKLPPLQAYSVWVSERILEFSFLADTVPEFLERIQERMAKLIGKEK